MKDSIVHEGCVGEMATPEAHLHPASSGRALRASKWAIDAIEAPASGRAGFGVSNVPPALSSERAEGVRA